MKLKNKSSVKQHRPTIFKVQRSIMTTHTREKALIYDKHREYSGEFDLDEDLREFMGDDFKIYVEGVIPKKGGKLRIIRKVDDRDW